MTDEERANLDAIVRAAGELAACAANVKLGYFRPETLEAAWQRLFALRWNYNMDDAPRDGTRIFLLWDGCTIVGAFDTRWLETPSDEQSLGWFTTEGDIHPDGYPTAWMPLPPPGKD